MNHLVFDGMIYDVFFLSLSLLRLFFLMLVGHDHDRVVVVSIISNSGIGE